MVILEIWGSILGRYVLCLGVLKWAQFVLSFSALVWTQSPEDLGF